MIFQLVEIVLGEVGPVVESEQKFCTRFFHMASDLLAVVETQSTSSGDSGGAGRNVEKQLADQVGKIFFAHSFINMKIKNKDNFSFGPFESCTKFLDRRKVF